MEDAQHPVSAAAGMQAASQLTSQVAAAADVSAPRISAKSSISRLAAVEVALMMQALTISERLQLARCSRLLYQHGQQPLAWKAGPVLHVANKISEWLERVQVRLLLQDVSASSLQRCAPIVLHWLDADQATVDRLKSCIDVKEIRMHRNYWGTVPEAVVHQILRESMVQRLRSFHMARDGRSVASVDVELLSNLPLLESLTLRLHRKDQQPHTTTMAPLAAFPALTNLRLEMQGEDLVGTAFPRGVIGACASLRKLTLAGAIFSRGVFAELCSSPAGRSLVHLSLMRRCRFARADSAAGYTLSAEELVADEVQARREELAESPHPEDDGGSNPDSPLYPSSEEWEDSEEEETESRTPEEASNLLQFTSYDAEMASAFASHSTAHFEC